MRAEREGRHIVAAAPRVAACPVLELEQPEIAKARLRERPAGRQARDASARDDYFRFLDCGRRGKIPAAKAVSARHVRALPGAPRDHGTSTGPPHAPPPPHPR